MKKIKIFLTLLILMTIITGCNLFVSKEKTKKKSYVFLSIEKDHEYGGNIVAPNGSGDYAYAKGAIALFEMKTTDGYKFIGWQGENGEEVVRKTSNGEITKWKILMNQDKNIKASYKMEEFKKIKSSPENGTKEIDYDIDQIKIYFNNELGISKAEDVISLQDEEGNLVGNNDNLRDIDYEIKENMISLKLNTYLTLSEKYKIEFAGNVWDEEGRMLSKSANFSFTVEDDSYPPDIPSSIGIKRNEGLVELVWERCEDNPKEVTDEYAEKYYIYRSSNEQEFKKIGEKTGDEIQISYKDNNVNLAGNTYFYYITAVDKDGNESGASNTVSTEYIN